MNRYTAVIATSLALSCAPAAAQSSGTSDVGRVMGGGQASEQQAYQRGALQGYELISELENARGKMKAADAAELELSARRSIAQGWVVLGKDPAEAEALAQGFHVAPEQIAINIRAAKEGRGATVRAALQAYERWDLLLANQLLLAAMRDTTPAD